MTANNLVTLPLEQVQLWGHNANLIGLPYEDVADQWGYEHYIANHAAQWGWNQREPEIQAVADQELEACCEEFSRFWDEVELVTLDDVLKRLRTSRRPKPPSLKEQALLQLDTLNADLAMHGRGCDLSQIRRALEALPDD
jgi:hypothetical protein